MNWVRKNLSCKCDADKSDCRLTITYFDEEGYDEFSKDEVKRICSWFHLSNQDEIVRLTPYDFKNRWEGVLSDNLAIKWIEFLFRGGPDEKCDQLWERLHWLLVKQWKTTCNDRAAIMLAVLGVEEDKVACQEVLKYIDDVMDSLHLIMEFSENSDFKKWIKCSTSTETNCFCSLRAYIQRDIYEGESMHIDEIEKWLRKVTVFRDILGEVCSLCVNLKPPARQLLPSPMCNLSWNSFINMGHIIFLSSQLEQDDTVEWRLLYNRKIHGGDLTTFGKCVRDKGPSLLLIKDENQYVFGAFISQPWTSGERFYGDDKCFLFTLSPEMDLYRPSGMNSNFIYFCENKESEKCGVGLGGCLENFSIWLGEGLDRGICSKDCLTYRNYVMPSFTPNFVPTELQVWATRDKCECKQDSITSIKYDSLMSFH